MNVGQTCRGLVSLLASTLLVGDAPAKPPETDPLKQLDLYACQRIPDNVRDMIASQKMSPDQIRVIMQVLNCSQDIRDKVEEILREIENSKSMLSRL